MQVRCLSAAAVPRRYRVPCDKSESGLRPWPKKSQVKSKFKSQVDRQPLPRQSVPLWVRMGVNIAQFRSSVQRQDERFQRDDHSVCDHWSITIVRSTSSSRVLRLLCFLNKLLRSPKERVTHSRIELVKSPASNSKKSPRQRRTISTFATWIWRFGRLLVPLAAWGSPSLIDCRRTRTRLGQ